MLPLHHTAALALVFLVGTAEAKPASLPTLGKRYQALRARDARNPPGKFDPVTDGADGELFRVMDQLRERLPGSKVRAIMGKPDRIEGPRLQYCWRGFHDYLIVEIDAGGKAVRTEWYMAGE
jgi:hypothetical protein